MSVTPNIMVVDDQGKKVINKNKAKLYWGEDATVIQTSWAPKVKIPQLEELVKAFQATWVAVAGGAVLAAYDAVEYNDIDLFPLCPAALEVGKDILCKLGYSITEVKDQYILFNKEDSCCRPVQLVTVHTDVNGDVQRMLNRFDLSVCQVAVYNGLFHSNSISVRDIKLKYLRVTGTSDINSLLLRLPKYAKRGYTPQAGDK